MSQPLLSVEDLHVVFNTYSGVVHAVNGMTFSVQPGEFFGLVGESGCGKSVSGLAIVRILPGKGSITGGRVLFHGDDLVQKNEAEMQLIRGRRIAMIFQDPSACLNPVFTVGNQIERVIRLHLKVSNTEARQRALAMFEAVALPEPLRVHCAYPHQLSGGMQQRVMIAMALASGADLLIADEPTTALDVTIQNQILELMVELRRSQNLTILLITHNLGVVAETCDRVGVAYAGRIVEVGPTAQITLQAKHPYTRGLLGAIPSAEQKGRLLQSIPGNVPNALYPLAGCPFQPRCPQRMDICSQADPPMTVTETPTHQVACYLYTGNGL